MCIYLSVYIYIYMNIHKYVRTYIYTRMSWLVLVGLTFGYDRPGYDKIKYPIPSPHGIYM